MRLDDTTERVLQRAFDGAAPTKEECVHLLTLPAASLEARALMAIADTVSRRRFDNHGMLLGQIGVETAPCPGNCGFCVFGEDHTTFEKTRLTNEEVIDRANSFAMSGDLYAIFLMTMHDFSFDDLLSVIAGVRQSIPKQTQIVVNIGDFEITHGRVLKEAGVRGAYHVCRLREGEDTVLDPEQRKQTFKVIRDSGLDFYFCCEPIGPEHTPEELVEQMFLGIEYGCFQHAAMRRVHVPSLPVSSRGQITELRLAQIVAVVALATLGCKETRNIAVHEPNLLGLTAGANVVYAETGANPRDVEGDTSRSRGLDMAAARRMLYEAGFDSLQLGDGASVSLDLPYLLETEAQSEGIESSLKL
jgi:biotin synthase